MTTHAERIIEYLERLPGRDDDEISRALGISPRQTVNITCRALEQAGRLSRQKGPQGKIVNYVRSPAVALDVLLLPSRSYLRLPSEKTT